LGFFFPALTPPISTTRFARSRRDFEISCAKMRIRGAASLMVCRFVAVGVTITGRSPQPSRKLLPGHADSSSMSTPLDYSIVIPAYNEEDLLPGTLGSCRRAMSEIETHTGEIIVSDNDSDDRTAEIARDAGALVVFEEHRQIARARNVGGFHASGRYLIFLDADTLITAAVLRQTLEALDSGDVCGGGTEIAMELHGADWVKMAFRFTMKVLRFCNWAAGAYVFCLREAFIDVGGFDERYYAAEEIHFSRAIKGWGRSRGMRFRVLEEPVSTSPRKMEWYTPRELFGMLLGTLFMPWRTKHQSGCKLWYTRPQAKPESLAPAYTDRGGAGEA
jgi:cellulose synthase/poly-beta-1,6-N-acetylglucosamine synthase-like glycosyltransferase